MTLNTQLPLTSTQLVDFTPEHQPDKKKPVSYTLTVPTPITQANYEAKLIENDARPIHEDVMLGEMRRAIRHLYEPKQAKELNEFLTMVEQYRNEYRELNKNPKDNKDALADLKDEVMDGDYAELENLLRKSWQPLKDLIVCRAKYYSLAPLLMCQTYIADVTNGFIKMTEPQLTDQQLMLIPKAHQLELYNKISSLLHPDKELEKN